MYHIVTGQFPPRLAFHSRAAVSLVVIRHDISADISSMHMSGRDVVAELDNQYSP